MLLPVGGGGKVVWYVFPGGREDTIDLSLILQESEGLG